MKYSCRCMSLPSSPTLKFARFQAPTTTEKSASSNVPNNTHKPNFFKRGLHWLKGDHENGGNKVASSGAAEEQPTKQTSGHSKLWKRKTIGGGNSKTDTAPDNATNPANPVEETPNNQTLDVPTIPQLIERTDSEKREKMQEVKPSNEERRAVSMDRRRSSRLSVSRGGDGAGFEFRGTATSLAGSNYNPRHTFDSLVPVATSHSIRSQRATVTSIHDPRASNRSLEHRPVSKAEFERERPLSQNNYHQRQSSLANDGSQAEDRLMVPLSPTEPPVSPSTAAAQSPDGPGWYYGNDMDYIDEELEWRWILNLSMHFRDRSDREKFFVTYAETPRLRRRVTVSCDYRNVEEGSLEFDLINLQYQADKSARIYESIRDSLLDIDFYDTVTNLKLQTENGRLHVHVTEDINEIISFPHVSMVAHLGCQHYRESELDFDSHLSGFVYKVRVGGEVYIKKEIPGPDTIDEFLYEVNALHALRESNSVIRFGGFIVDERDRHVRGLLIAFASKGSLIDIVYKERGQLTWKRREKWARQILSGVSEIHEAGFVQGDLTMSNMVVDEDDDVKIIDINRRGCPIGWEPPEIAALIDTQQRIGMFIGVKSDLYQLGMVLWGLVYQVDEPETAAKPLNMDAAPPEIPDYFKEIVMTCLSPNPKDRISARELLLKFPPLKRDSPPPPINIVQNSTIETPKSSPASSRSPGSLRTKNIGMLFPDSPNGGMFVESPVDLSPSATRSGGFDALDSIVHSIKVEPNPSSSAAFRGRQGKPTDTDQESLVLGSIGSIDSMDVPDVPPESPVMEVISSPASENVGGEWRNWALENHQRSTSLDAAAVVVEPVARDIGNDTSNNGGVVLPDYYDEELSPRSHPPMTTSNHYSGAEPNGSTGSDSGRSTPQPPQPKNEMVQSDTSKRSFDEETMKTAPPFERMDSMASNGVYLTPSEEFPSGMVTPTNRH